MASVVDLTLPFARRPAACIAVLPLLVYATFWQPWWTAAVVGSAVLFALSIAMSSAHRNALFAMWAVVAFLESVFVFALRTHDVGWHQVVCALLPLLLTCWITLESTADLKQSVAVVRSNILLLERFLFGSAVVFCSLLVAQLSSSVLLDTIVDCGVGSEQSRFCRAASNGLVAAIWTIALGWLYIAFVSRVNFRSFWERPHVSKQTHEVTLQEVFLVADALEGGNIATPQLNPVATDQSASSHVDTVQVSANAPQSKHEVPDESKPALSPKSSDRVLCQWDVLLFPQQVVKGFILVLTGCPTLYLVAASQWNTDYNSSTKTILVGEGVCLALMSLLLVYYATPIVPVSSAHHEKTVHNNVLWILVNTPFEASPGQKLGNHASTGSASVAAFFLLSGALVASGGVIMLPRHLAATSDGFTSALTAEPPMFSGTTWFAIFVLSSCTWSASVAALFVRSRYPTAVTIPTSHKAFRFVKRSHWIGTLATFVTFVPAFCYDDSTHPTCMWLLCAVHITAGCLPFVRTFQVWSPLILPGNHGSRQLRSAVLSWKVVCRLALIVAFVIRCCCISYDAAPGMDASKAVLNSVKAQLRDAVFWAVATFIYICADSVTVDSTFASSSINESRLHQRRGQELYVDFVVAILYTQIPWMAAVWIAHTVSALSSVSELQSALATPTSNTETPHIAVGEVMQTLFFLVQSSNSQVSSWFDVVSLVGCALFGMICWTTRRFCRRRSGKAKSNQGAHVTPALLTTTLFVGGLLWLSWSNLFSTSLGLTHPSAPGDKWWKFFHNAKNSTALESDQMQKQSVVRNHVSSSDISSSEVAQELWLAMRRIAARKFHSGRLPWTDDENEHGRHFQGEVCWEVIIRLLTSSFFLIAGVVTLWTTNTNEFRGQRSIRGTNVEPGEPNSQTDNAKRGSFVSVLHSVVGYSRGTSVLAPAVLLFVLVCVPCHEDCHDICGTRTLGSVAVLLFGVVHRPGRATKTQRRRTDSRQSAIRHNR